MNRQTRISKMNKAKRKVWFYSKKMAEATTDGATEMYDGLIRMYEEYIKKLATM